MDVLDDAIILGRDVQADIRPSALRPPEKPDRAIVVMPLSRAQASARTMFSESPDEEIVTSTSPGRAAFRN